MRLTNRNIGGECTLNLWKSHVISMSMKKRQLHVDRSRRLTPGAGGAVRAVRVVRAVRCGRCGRCRRCSRFGQCGQCGRCGRCGPCGWCGYVGGSTGAAGAGHIPATDPDRNETYCSFLYGPEALRLKPKPNPKPQVLQAIAVPSAHADAKPPCGAPSGSRKVKETSDHMENLFA